MKIQPLNIQNVFFFVRLDRIDDEKKGAAANLRAAAGAVGSLGRPTQQEPVERVVSVYKLGGTLRYIIDPRWETFIFVAWLTMFNSDFNWKLLDVSDVSIECTTLLNTKTGTDDLQPLAQAIVCQS